MERLNRLSKRATEILKNGELLQVTESLAYRRSNNYDFARRIGREIGLIFSGQAIKYLNIGQKDRAYSHCGIFAPPGMGKDFAYNLMVDSGIFPKDVFRIERLDNITPAALEGTIFGNKIVPPPTITADLIVTSEWASLASGTDASSLLADLRVMWENGKYTRRLAKIGKLDEILETASVETAGYIQGQIDEYKKKGLYVDTSECKINVETTSSWIIASADFGSQTKFGKSLLTLGDLCRIRWLSYHPTKAERIKVISDVGSLPPVIINTTEERACNEAWRTTIMALKKTHPKGIKIPRDNQSHYERKRIWNETVKEMMDTYPQLEKNVNFDQLMSLRSMSEFRRLVYQYAATQQFARDSGNDLSISEKFKIDYKIDGEFAKRLWLEDYVPSMLDIISNVLSRSDKPAKHTTKTSMGIKQFLKRMANGPVKRPELLTIARQNDISEYLVDNRIIPNMIELKLIKREKGGWYSLRENRDETK